MVEVGIIMGSKSDLPIMQDAADALKELGIKFEMTVVSAHRTPERMFDYAKKAQARGIKVIIAGAGGAAHLPGMVASLTALPIIGVPIKSSNSIDGWDFTNAWWNTSSNSSIKWCKKCWDFSSKHYWCLK